MIISTSARRLSAMLLALSLAPAVQAAEAPAAPRPPVAAFFDNPTFTGALLSPSGKYLALRVGGKGQRDRLGVLELATDKVTVVGSFEDADIGSFAWVNDERLTYSAADRQVAQGDVRYGPGLYAVNRDGSNFRQLVNRSSHFITVSTGAREPLPWNTFLLRQNAGQNSDYVYVTHPNFDGPGQVSYVDLQRLNTVNGRITSVSRPGDSRSWILDNKGEPRLTRTVEKGSSFIQYLDPETKEWRKLTSFTTYIGGKDWFAPLAFGPDGTFYVIAHKGQDKSTVHTFDLKTGTVSDQPLIQVSGFDFRGYLIMDENKLLGVRYWGEAEDTVWFAPAMKAIQADVDQLLPGTINLITRPTRAETPWLLVVSYSDTLPRTTLLYNSATKALRNVGSAHPDILPEQMAHEKAVHYQARDGFDIPAWLTVPRGEGKHLPLVVLVHGGPYSRGGSWGWDADAQFLASRGYAVIKPEFRGSTGYGSAHFRAGWKQWGLKMQDDITDAARWAIAQGIADPKRVCIAGGDYGGYAALMGLIREPELFRCGIDWAGVTDINLLYDGHWSFTSDLPEAYKQYGMPVLVGDQQKDAEQFKATSPLLHAGEIKQPLLLAYGGSDYRVPLYHGSKFYQAVKQSNPQVEWIEYPEEGHGWYLPQNRIDFWTRVEKFLAKNLAQP